MPLTVHGLAEIEALDGRDLGRSAWREVTQEQIDAFADVSGDHQWIHTDVQRAAAGPYGSTLAHGFMILSWGIPLLTELLEVTGVGMALNYGTEKVRFPSPVPVGSRVRLHARIAQVRRVDDDGLHVVREFTFERDGAEKPACAAQSLTRYYA